MRSVEISQGLVRLIDQRQIPAREEVLECTTVEQVADAIRSLAVRGAPAIGVSAAGGLALAAYNLRHLPEAEFWAKLEAAAALLRSTRPTAVNLFWAIKKVMDYAAQLKGNSPGEVAHGLLAYAQDLAEQDVTVNKAIAAFGATLIRDGDGVLTHCNTGSLATVDYGTALGIIRYAHEQGKKLHCYVDETRPVLQGARLTAWECLKFGIPATLISDNMAAHMMKLGKIQAVFVGADRITANGDTANKIGTYNVAIIAKEHGIPFYVAAPTSTVDLSLAHGDQIEIEERNPQEVTHVFGTQVAPAGIQVANPAFDVTPHKYITGIVTEKGIAYPPFDVNLKRFVEGG
jgi:methylthioribose-1-phosphate isomerase